MFGGLCFLLRGNMLCGTGKADFMFRVGKDQDAAALKRAGARPMDITGRVMKGFVWVESGAKCDSRTLEGVGNHGGALCRRAAGEEEIGDGFVHPNTRYLFTASMDVDPEKEALFNEVYDTEHVPLLQKVPGVLAVTRTTSRAPLQHQHGRGHQDHRGGG